MLGRIFSVAIMLALVASAQAAVLTVTPTAPVPGAIDISNLIGCTTDADNAGTPDGPPYTNDETTYVAMDRGGQGQTFVTAGDPNGYVVKGVWVKHVSYTGAADITWYQMAIGGVLQVRITNPAAAGTDAFALSTETYTVTGSEPNALPATSTNTPTGTGLWFHVALDNPVKLAADTLYGFDLTSLSGMAGNLFFETDGIRDGATGGNPYAAGAAYVTGSGGKSDNNMTAAPGDRVFVVELAVAKPKVIWVSFHAGADDAPSTNAAGIGFTVAPDKGYTDLLAANGYDVQRYLTTGTPDVNMLNKADLVIVGRSINSAHFQNAAATIWNTQIKKPMIITSGYALRKSRLGLVTNSTGPVDITGDIKLTVTDPTNPIFAGVALTDGTMDNAFAGVALYPTDGTAAFGISVSPDAANAEGKVLATMTADAATTPGGLMIAEWLPGASLVQAAATDVLAGRRLVFLTGSRESGGKTSESAGMFDLTADGSKMFLNAVAYMIAPIPPKKIAVVNASFEEPGTVKQNCWDGGTNAKGTFVDVPGWSSDTMANDSGVEQGWNPTDGVWTGFLMGTDPSVFNTTTYEMKDTENYLLSVDAVNNWTADAALPAKLALTLYVDISGVRLPLATTTVEVTSTYTTFTLELKADAVGAAAGMPIGIELKNASNATDTANSWIGIDNVVLTASL